jgi:hypothetical protein
MEKAIAMIAEHQEMDKTERQGVIEKEEQYAATLREKVKNQAGSKTTTTSPAAAASPERATLRITRAPR